MSTMTPAAETVAAACGAACAAEPERGLMFPPEESVRPGRPNAAERRALTICAGCPVLAACCRAVLATQDSAPMSYGVAGGMTAADRRAVRAAGRGQSGPESQSRSRARRARRAGVGAAGGRGAA